MRTHLVATLLVAGFVLAPPARAWDRPTELVHGTARVLEKGEMVVGILSPLGYGIHERVTIFTHPIIDLLLTPNAWLRVDIWSDETWAVAGELGYQQSFLSVTSLGTSASSSSTLDENPALAGGDAPRVDAPAEYPGYLQAGFVASFAVRMLQVTLGAGYEGRFSGKDDLSEVFLYYRVGLDLLADERNLVMMRVLGDVGLNKGNSFEIPTVSLLYAHEFGRLRLGAGVAAGSFPLKGLPDKFDVWPVYPWLDLWWRF